MTAAKEQKMTNRQAACSIAAALSLAAAAYFIFSPSRAAAPPSEIERSLPVGLQTPYGKVVDNSRGHLGPNAEDLTIVKGNQVLRCLFSGNGTQVFSATLTTTEGKIDAFYGINGVEVTQAEPRDSARNIDETTLVASAQKAAEAVGHCRELSALAHERVKELTKLGL